MDGKNDMARCSIHKRYNTSICFVELGHIGIKSSRHGRGAMYLQDYVPFSIAAYALGSDNLQSHRREKPLTNYWHRVRAVLSRRVPLANPSPPANISPKHTHRI